MKFISIYWKIVSDPSEPSNRVMRKVALLTTICIGILIYYRHVVLGFEFGEPTLVTAALAFMEFAVVGVFGGTLAAFFTNPFLAQWKLSRRSQLFRRFSPNGCSLR